MGRDAWLRRSSGSATDGGRSSLGMTRAPGQRALAPLLLVGGLRWVARGGCGSHGGRWSAWWTPDRTASACVARARMSRASPCLGACVASARVPRTPCESFSRKLAKISSYVRSSVRAWPSGCGRTRRVDIRGTDLFCMQTIYLEFCQGAEWRLGRCAVLASKGASCRVLMRWHFVHFFRSWPVRRKKIRRAPWVFAGGAELQPAGEWRDGAAARMRVAGRSLGPAADLGDGSRDGQVARRLAIAHGVG